MMGLINHGLFKSIFHFLLISEKSLLINLFLKSAYLVTIDWSLFRINNIINGTMLILSSVLLLSSNDHFLI